MMFLCLLGLLVFFGGGLVEWVGWFVGGVVEDGLGALEGDVWAVGGEVVGWFEV
jgi:hypothetical protein